MKSEKGKVGIIICIIIIVLLVAGCGALFYFGFFEKGNEIEDLESDKKKLKTQVTEYEEKIETLEKDAKAKEEKESKKITGEYKAEIKGEDLEARDPEEGALYDLTLYKDGTYEYEWIYYSSNGTIGNYYIEDDTLILNAWFTTGSDISVTATNTQIKLTLNDDGTISDTNGALGVSEVIMKKEKEEGSLEKQSVNYKIHTPGLGNEHGYVAN